MNKAELFFIQECVAHARTNLPLREALTYLSGMLTICGDNPAVSAVRNAFIQMSDSDRQLELIQMGQLPLPLQPHKS